MTRRTWVRSGRYRRVVAALFAAAAVGLGSSALRPAAAPGVRVLAVARDLPGGAPLRAQDLRTVELPAAAVPAGALRSGAAGRVLASPVRRGEPITDARLLGPGLLDRYGPGTVATPIRVADAGSVRLLRPGDLIDVLAASPPDGMSSGAPPDDTFPGPPPGEDPPPATGPHSTGRLHPSRLPPTGDDPRGVPLASGGPALTTPLLASGGPALAAPRAGNAPARTAPFTAPRPPRGGSLVEAGRGERPDAPWRSGHGAGGAVRWARVIVSGVRVVAVPRAIAGSVEQGALVVLATDRVQAAALVGAAGPLAVTICATVCADP